jgi:hypothetical protein
MNGLRGRPAWRGPAQHPDVVPGFAVQSAAGTATIASGIDERALILSLQNVGIVIRSSKSASKVAQDLVLPKRIEIVADLQLLNIGFRGRGRSRVAAMDVPRVRERNRLLFRSAVVSIDVDTFPPLTGDAAAYGSAPRASARTSPKLISISPPDVSIRGKVDLSGFDIRLDATGVESAATFGAVWAAALPRGGQSAANASAPGTGTGLFRTSSMRNPRTPESSYHSHEDTRSPTSGETIDSSMPAMTSASHVPPESSGYRRRIEMNLLVHASPGKCTIDPKTAEWVRPGADEGGTAGGGTLGSITKEPALLCVPLPDLAVTLRIGLLLPAQSPSDATSNGRHDIGGGKMHDNVVALRVEMPIEKDGSIAEVFF